MIPKLLGQIALVDIEALRAGQVPEGRTIDYKRELPGGADAEKKEFLADVSSFANTVGGDLIYGVDETGGIPTAIVGVAAADIDAEILRLNGIILTGLAPRIRHDVLRVPCGNTTVIVLRVEQSWIGPHRVIFGGHDKFYARNSAGKYPLDVIELRQAFLRASSVAEQIRSFRENRLIEIAAGRTLVGLMAGSRLVLHLIPLEAFTTARQVDVMAYYRTPKQLPPMSATGWTHRITLDGVLTYSLMQSGEAMAYTHLHRNGIIEAVDAYTLNHVHKGERLIPSTAFEDQILAFSRTYLDVQNWLGVAAPVYVLMTLLRVKGCRMGVSNLWEAGEPIDRELLQLPEAVVMRLADDVGPIMKGTIDLVWNACGFERSPNFDNAGNWRRPR